MTTDSKNCQPQDTKLLPNTESPTGRTIFLEVDSSRHSAPEPRDVRTNQGKCREDAGERFERPLRQGLRNCVLAYQAFLLLPACESASAHSCKTCRFRERWLQTAANVAAAMVRRLLCWTAAVLLADAVLFDLVLKRTEADTKQFCRFLAMVGDFGKSSADRFTFNRFQCGP
jgi:hypothetical protein